MSCNICQASEYITILNKRDIPIWTGSEQVEGESYPCNIKQCTSCGHIYEEISLELSQKLTKIYSSVHAQASTPPGDGNWGLKRAEFFLKKINYKQHTSAIEIGCADGFFLKFLQNNGYNKLIGIEPSLSHNIRQGNIEFISAFADEKTRLGHKVDLIFSNAVFEHIEDINGVLQFCKNHLNKDGELFFAVPNAQIELENGDPALFIHEHVHYYTHDVLMYLLANNGFKATSIVQECNVTYVRASLSDATAFFYTPNLYTNYTKALEQKLKIFENIMGSYKNVLIHGANNKLNNILGWSNNNFSFTLVDNDENKHTKSFFNHKVYSIKELDLHEYDCIVVIPTCFYQAIESEYIALGYSKKIYQV